MTIQTQARAVPRQRGLDETWEQLADGLFTYCLSVLCDQDDAVAAMLDVRRLAARHRRRLRRPALLRAWFYALARYCCLVRMEREAGSATRPKAQQRVGRHSVRHAHLSRLAWPEAAGTTPAQREALELTGRHGLSAAELAAVLDLRPEAASALLAQAVCEVERTAAALIVLDVEDCPELRRLGSERGPVLGPALRGELVRHLDTCPTCRGTAERAAALGPWPGTLRAPGALPILGAPGELLQGPVAGGILTQFGRRDDHDREPRFDRRGFPVHRSERSERAAMLRQRAVAGSVIAAVVAAPVVALWTTHHHRHLLVAASPVSAISVEMPQQQDAVPPAEPAEAAAGLGTGRRGAGVGPAATPAAAGPAAAATAPAAAGGAAPAPVAAPARLAVSASEVGGRTLITLTDSGGTAVAWQASTPAPWLRLSRDEGTLQPGATITVLVTVDEALTPAGPWSAQLTIRPAGAVVTLKGPGTGRSTPPPSSSPAPSQPPGATPTPSASAGGSASAAPTTSASPSAPSASASNSVPASESVGQHGRHRRPPGG